MKYIYSFPGRLQASSHNFLSAIFGILGKFGIEIGNPPKNGRKIVRRKKSENFWSDFFGRIFLLVENIFLIENFSSKFSMKKKSTNSFRIFFDDKFYDQHCFEYLFRSQISPRFQKSYLENYPISLATLHEHTVRKTRKCCSYYDLYNGGFKCKSWFVLYPVGVLKKKPSG